jgi:VanZ family protein
MLPMLSETRKRALFCVLIMALLGVALEFGQMLSPGRSADVMDALADSCGLLTGMIVAYAVRRVLTSIRS